METKANTSNGWHRETISAYAAATSTSKEMLIVWRTQTVECCGRTIHVATDVPPVWVDGSYGEVRESVSQCGGCGSLYAAHFSAREV